MLLPDDLIIKRNCSKDMIKIHKKMKCSIMASMKVNKKTVSRWGIYSKKKNINNNNFIISDVVEKPNIRSAPSNNAVIGRYILPKKIFSNIRSSFCYYYVFVGTKFEIFAFSTFNSEERIWWC